MLLITRADYNTIAIFILLSVIIYYVSGFNKRIRNLYKKPEAWHYLNTTAKIKALEYSPNGVISLDSNGSIIAWNKGASDLFGYVESEVIGKSLTFIIPERFREAHIMGMEKLKTSGYSTVLGRTLELYALNKKGLEFPIKLTIWRWTEDSHVFYTGIVHDITERKNKEKETESILDMYRRGEEADNSGVWSWDVLNDIVYVSDGFKKIFNIDKTKVDSTYLLKRVYHEDLKSVEDTIKKAFENKEGYRIRYRIVNTNGTLVQVEINSEVFFNSNSELINITIIPKKFLVKNSFMIFL